MAAHEAILSMLAKERGGKWESVAFKEITQSIFMFGC